MFSGYRAALRQGFEPVTLDWMRRVTRIDPADYLYHANNFIRSATGRRVVGNDPETGEPIASRNWLGAFADFLLLNSTGASSLEGLKGLVKASEVEEIGTPIHIPWFGWQRSEAPEAVLESYLRLNLTPQQIPGVTDASQSILEYAFTNFLGLYNDMGTAGSGSGPYFGMLFRCSSGFRPNFALNSSNLLYGGGPQWGFHLAWRPNEFEAMAYREDSPWPLQSVITTVVLNQSTSTSLAADADGVGSRLILGSGDPQAAGLVAGDIITVSGASLAANNRSFTIIGFSGTDILVTPAALTMAADPTFSIQANGATFTNAFGPGSDASAGLLTIAADASDGTITFGTTLPDKGFVVGSYFTVTGILLANADVLYRIQSFASDFTVVVTPAPASDMAADNNFTLNRYSAVLTQVGFTSLAAHGGPRLIVASGDPVASGLMLEHTLRVGGIDHANNHALFKVKGFEGTTNREILVTPAPVTMSAQAPFTLTAMNRLNPVPHCILSAEPGSGNTPNGLSFWGVGPGNGWDGEKALQCRTDIIRFLTDLGVYDVIEQPEGTAGTNCFGPEALGAVVPTAPPAMRHFSRLTFPTLNTTPAATYAGWPITDSVSGFFSSPTLTSSHTTTPAQPTDPIETTSGSDLAWISEPLIQPFHRYYGCSLIGYTGGNGIAANQINGRRLIVADDQVGKRIQIKLGGTASASGFIGGIDGVATYTTMQPRQSAGFVPPRTGRFTNFLPIFRSVGQDVINNGGTINPKASATTPKITRATDLAGTTIKAGAQGLFMHSTYAKAIYAFLTYSAYNAGYTEFNEPRDGLHAPYAMPGHANVGNGTVTDIAAVAPANGFYRAKFVDTITYSVTKPNGLLMGAESLGNLFSAEGLTFRINLGSIPFAPGDTIAIVAKTANQGWRDIAREGGYADDAVQHWHWFYANADTEFTEVTGAAAGCRDKVCINSISINDMNWTLSQMAQCFDAEQADHTDPDIHEFRMNRWNNICGAVGIKWHNWGHVMDEDRARSNGFTRDNIQRIIRLSHNDGFLLPTTHDNKPGGLTCIDYCNNQWTYCSGPAGDNPPPPQSVIMRGMMSAGKYYVNDDAPLGQYQPPVGLILDHKLLGTLVASASLSRFTFGMGDAVALGLAVDDKIEPIMVPGVNNNQTFTITAVAPSSITVTPAPADMTTVVTLTQATLGAITAVPAADPRLIFTAGNPQDEGLQVGDIILLASVQANNARTFEITGFEGTEGREVLVTPAPNLMAADTAFRIERAEPPLTLTQADLGSIAADPGSGRFIVASNDPMLLGLASGDTIYLTGIAHENLGARFTITSFTGTSNREILVSPSPAAMGSTTPYTLNGETTFILRAWLPVDITGVYAGKPREKIDWTRTFSAWMASKGITKFASNLNGTSFGGTIDRYINQQLRGYLPYLADTTGPVAELPGPQADAWRAAVEALGGTVSDLRYELIYKAINALILEGLWGKIRYMGLLAGENSQQMLVDVRQRLQGIPGASTAAPTFTANRGLTFDGANDVHNTTFVPVTHGGDMAFDKLMQAVYLRVENPQASSAAQSHMGTATVGVAGAAGQYRMLVRSATGSNLVNLLCSNANIANGAITTTAGFSLVQRDGTALSGWRNGVQNGTTLTAAGSGSILPDVALRLGCQYNNLGVAVGSSFIACDQALVLAGLPLTAVEQPKLYAIVQTLLFDIGAAIGARPVPAPW